MPSIALPFTPLLPYIALWHRLESLYRLALPCLCIALHYHALHRIALHRIALHRLAIVILVLCCEKYTVAFAHF
jgi:hypothetical protein